MGEKGGVQFVFVKLKVTRARQLVQTAQSVTKSVRDVKAALLEGQGEVVLAGLAVPDKVAGLFAQSQQGLCVYPADCSMVPAVKNRERQEFNIKTRSHNIFILTHKVKAFDNS